MPTTETGMHPVTGLISHEDALERILGLATSPTRTEQLPLGAAAGRVVADTLTSAVDVPSDRRSAMDGYAVRSRDATEGARLRLRGVIHAGETPPEAELPEGACDQIATGGLVPSGADAVVMVEHTRREGDAIIVDEAASAGQHVVPIGRDVTVGDVVARPGDVLGPGRLGLLAAVGMDTVSVYAQPRVRIHGTGTEVRPLGADLAPGQVFDSNAVALATLFELDGAEVQNAPIVPDEEHELESALGAAAEVDLLVLTGGTSAGARDLAPGLVAKLGEVVVHGVRIKPGKPILAGKIQGTPVVVLPGFPASCVLTAQTYVRPLLRRLAGRPEPPDWGFEAELAHEFASPEGKHHLVPVRLQDGRAVSTFVESGATRSLADAEGLVEVGAEVTRLPQGSRVWVRPFP